MAEAKLCFSCIAVNVEKMIATALITPYLAELKRFFKLNPKQSTISILQSRTQALVGHLLVNSN